MAVLSRPSWAWLAQGLRLTKIYRITVRALSCFDRVLFRGYLPSLDAHEKRQGCAHQN